MKTFTCNTRETVSCDGCGSTQRFRSIAYLVSRAANGTPQPLPSLSPNRALKVLGMSDAGIYSERLMRVYDYVNTYYHQEPLLDITCPRPQYRESADILISSDVFEHVPTPVELLFSKCRCAG